MVEDLADLSPPKNKQKAISPVASNKSDEVDDAAELMSEAVKQADTSLLKKRSFQ